MNKTILLVLVILVMSLSACGGGTTSTEVLPTSAPTPTPKPRVDCSQEEVDAYLEQFGYTLEKWDDTYQIAMSTSRASLAPILGELQGVKRDVSHLDAPECAVYINDITVVAMENSIGALISFLSNDGDSIVQRKLKGAENSWGIVNTEIDNFKSDPMEAYMAFNMSTEELQESIEQPVEFMLPEGWIDTFVTKGFTISYPDDWDFEEYGENDEFLSLTNDDGTLEIKGGLFDGGLEIESDSGRLFVIQSYLETKDFDFYLEHSADVEVYSLNKVYIVEYSVRESSGDDIQDQIMAYVYSPDGEVFLFVCKTTRDEFAQIDLLQIQNIFGSIRK